MRDVYIIGAGGFGKEVADTIAAMNEAGESFRIAVNGSRAEHRLAGYIDDDASRLGEVINEIPIVGGVEKLLELSEATYETSGVRPSALISIADPAVKKRMAKIFDGKVEWINAVHPLANLTPFAEIGKGVVIQSFACVGPNVRLGDHVHVNVHTSIGHDAQAHDFVSVMTLCSISGYVDLGECAYVGSNAVVVPGKKIGENTRIGAGSVVTKDMPPNVTAFGNPCKVAKNSG